MSSTAGAQPWRIHGVRTALRDQLNKVPSRSIQCVYLASRLVFIVQNQMASKLETRANPEQVRLSAHDAFEPSLPASPLHRHTATPNPYASAPHFNSPGIQVASCIVVQRFCFRRLQAHIFAKLRTAADVGESRRSNTWALRKGSFIYTLATSNASKARVGARVVEGAERSLLSPRS